MQSYYYIYAHKNPITKHIFYIGMGKNDRAFERNSRNKKWHTEYLKLLTEGLCHEIEILHICKDKNEAAILEKKEIESRAGLTNIANIKKQKTDCVKNDFENYCLHLGKKIKDHRRNKGLTQKELSEIVGIRVRKLVYIEQGKIRKMEFESILNLIRYFDINIYDAV